MKTKFLFLIIIIASHIGYSQIFYDDVSGETMGGFPSKWDVITGMATVEAIDGFNTISLLHGSIIKPVVNNQTNNYINGDFTIEFDAFFGKTSSIYGQRIIVRLWNGKYSHKQGNIRYNPFIIKRNGISTSWLQPESGKAENFFKDLHTLEPIWRHVKIACKNSKLKIFLDNKLILNLPRFKMQPTMVSIGGAINDSKYDAKVGIANFTIVSSTNDIQIAMIVDRKTNRVIDINSVSNLQKIPNLKNVYPNTKTFLGTISGNHELRPVEFSDVKKPNININNSDTQTVRPYEFSDIKKPQFIDLNAYGRYTLLPEKEAQMVFDFEKEFITGTLNFNNIKQYSFDTSSNTIKGDYFETNTVLKTPTKNLTLKDNLFYLLPAHDKTLIGETEKNLSTNTSINNPNITTPIIGNPTPNLEDNIVTSSHENNNSNTNSGVINQIKFNRNISDEAHLKMEELLPKGIQSFSFSPNGGWVIITKDNKHFARNIPPKCYEKIKEYVSRGIKIKEVVFPPNGGNNSWIIITENDTYARNIPQECYEKIQSFKQQGKSIESVSFPYKNIFNDSNNAWVILTTDGQFYTRNIPDECYQIMRNIRQTHMPNKPSDRKINKVSFTPSGGWTVLADDYFFSRNIPEEAFKKLGEFRGKGYNNSILVFDPDKNGWSVVANKRLKNIPSNKIRAFEQNIRGKSIWDYLRDNKIPGVAVAVVINSELAWSTGYRFAINKDVKYAVHPETMFQAASISKLVAAVGACKMIEEENVGLDDNLQNNFLKEKIPVHNCFTNYTDTLSVTIRNILNHTSGIDGRNITLRTPITNQTCDTQGGGYSGYPINTELKDIPNIDEIIEGKSNEKANSEPITITYNNSTQMANTGYSGPAFSVLQKVTEDITSSKYEIWMKDKILKPLSMTKSLFTVKPENDYEKKELTMGFYTSSEVDVRNRYPEAAAAGLYTNAKELANLLIMLNNGGSFNNKRIISNTNALLISQGLGSNISDSRIRTNSFTTYYSHGGTNEGYRAFIIGFPNISAEGINNAGIVVLTNGDITQSRYDIVNAIINTYGW